MMMFKITLILEIFLWILYITGVFPIDHKFVESFGKRSGLTNQQICGPKIRQELHKLCNSRSLHRSRNVRFYDGKAHNYLFPSIRGVRSIIDDCCTNDKGCSFKKLLSYCPYYRTIPLEKPRLLSWDKFFERINGFLNQVERPPEIEEYTSDYDETLEDVLRNQTWFPPVIFDPIPGKSSKDEIKRLNTGPIKIPSEFPVSTPVPFYQRRLSSLIRSDETDKDIEDNFQIHVRKFVQVPFNKKIKVKEDQGKKGIRNYGTQTILIDADSKEYNPVAVNYD